uniref:hypothetical protein n=1 Tax=Roseivirga sp. TaxID=1964215 RepID=UPI004047AEBA
MDEINNPEDGLDKIVRKASEEARFEFNEQAWAAMDKKLDAASATSKSFDWRKIIGPAILLVILSLTNFWPLDAALNNSVEVKQEGKVEEVQKGFIQDDKTDVKAKSPQTTIIDEEKPEKVEVTDLVEPKNQNSDLYKTPSEVNVKQEVTYFTTEEQRVSESLNGTEREDLELIDLRWSPLGLILDKPFFIEIPSSFILKEVEDSLEHTSKWAIAAFASGDFSATGLSGFTKPGTLYGLSAEYFLSDNWSLATGFALSTKKYSALGAEYSPPSWTQGVSYAVHGVNAVCKVIDIPINFRRYFESKKDHRFFTSAGLSSYLMLREDYNYDYNGNHPAWPTEWSVKNQNQHYLGILNFSIGYEKPLTNRLALGLEPYVKLPLTGIGAGEVKFLSFGANLAFKWR